MNNKQKRFCEEYLICNNATKAAASAGYSEKTAKQIGSRLLKDPEITEYLDAERERIRSEKIAVVEEILERVTAILRDKEAYDKDKLKAAELLGKHYGMFSENVRVALEPVTIVNDIRE